MNLPDDTVKYRSTQLLKADQGAMYEYPQKIKVIGKNGESNWLNITHKEYLAICEILTGENFQ